MLGGWSSPVRGVFRIVAVAIAVMFLCGAWMELSNHWRITALGVAWLVMGIGSLTVAIRGRLG